MDTILLRNGVAMPLLGYGVFQIGERQCRRCVRQALDAGYRLIDTAACYGNERAVGEAAAESGLAREALFLVSKVWIQDAGYERTKASFDKTLSNLKTDYLDLYLVHMPYGDYHGSWRAMEELYRSGRVRAVGVCNFQQDRLADLILSHDLAPMVNQMELHPFCQQRALGALMERYSVQMMAWAPFAEGRRDVFQNELLASIGARHRKTPAQVILRWLRQKRVVAIPKSVHDERIRQNFAVDDFSLSPGEMALIDGMDGGEPLILDITSVEEAFRLHGVRFEQ